MESLIADLRFAVRSLKHRRTFTIVAVLTIALGIGPTATMYSVMSGILLNPLGYKDPGKLVAITGHFANGGDVPLSMPEFLALRQTLAPRVFSALTSTFPVVGNLTGADRPERIGSSGATGEYFDVLGVKPLLGRTWTTAEETPGITQINVISYELWQQRFGGRADVVGKTIRIDDDEYIIIGVMPKGFSHPGSTRANPVQLWYLCGFTGTPFPPANRLARTPAQTVYARLAPGVSLAQAQAELSRAARGWVSAYPEAYPARLKGFSVSVTPLNDVIVAAPVRRGLLGLMIAVSLVLLIACANVAGLQLMRGIGRVGEITVRGALGATRFRLVRQLLTESAVIGIAGGALGLLMAIGMVGLVRANLPDTMPRATDVHVNAGVVAIGIAVTTLLTALFGVLPALTSTRISLASSLRASAAAAVGSASRARTWLVVGEIALAVLLLSGAGLFMRSFWALQRVDPGFRTDHLLTLQLAIPYPNHPERGKYVTPSARIPYYTEVLRKIAELPNVEGVALAGLVPFTPPVFQGGQGVTFSAEGATIADPADLPRAQFRVVGPGYFKLLGIPLHDGRDFTTADDSAAAVTAGLAILINESLAHKAWPTGGAVGKRLAIGPPGRQRFFNVVGVVADSRSLTLDQVDGPILYSTYTQNPPFQIGVMVRTRGDAAAMQTPITRVVQAIEPDQPVFGVATMEDLLGSDVSQRRYAALAVAIFAALALTLSGIGVYGLIAFMVSQRTRELGLRMALGSTPGAALKLVFGHGFRLTLIGAALGLAAAIVGATWVKSMVFGVSLHDPVAFVAAPLVLLIIAAVACWAPARRAAAIDPIVALRME